MNRNYWSCRFRKKLLKFLQGVTLLCLSFLSQSNSDAEWKYARARLRMSYFNEIGCIPPPFNLIPVRLVVKLCQKMLCCRCAKSGNLCKCCRKGKSTSRHHSTDPSILEAQHKVHSFLQRAWIVRTLGYNEQVFFLRKEHFWLISMFRKVRIQCERHRFMN